jgi:hypothetical protein
MQSSTPVEIADRMSRRRAVGVAVAAVVFLGIQFVTRPFFVSGPNSAPTAKIDMWAVNAIVLLVLLATGGGLLNRRRIQALINDEVSRANYRTSVIAGFWVAMIGAMGLYVVPRFASFTGREVIYLIVTITLGVALLTFSWLEHRAHRDE